MLSWKRNGGSGWRERQSKQLLLCISVLSPNQRPKHSALNSSNYLKDNQWLFTCQSRRKYNPYRCVSTSAHTETHTCTRPHTTLTVGCCSQHVSWYLIYTSYIKTCHLERPKKHQKILTGASHLFPDAAHTPAYCSSLYPWTLPPH